MTRTAVLLLTLGLAACGGSYMDTKHTQKPEAVPSQDTADWREYGHPDDADVFVSYASIGHKDKFGPAEYTYAWVWRKFKKDQTPQDGDAYRSEYTRFAMDCATSEMASIALERRDAEDKVVLRRDIPPYQWEIGQGIGHRNGAVSTGTFMQDFFSQVCKIARQKETGTEEKPSTADATAAPADKPADGAPGNPADPTKP